MPCAIWGRFDFLNRFIYFVTKTGGEAVGNICVIPLELPDIVRKLRVKEHFHPNAERYSSSVRPFTRPVATSSMRRMPSATALLTDSGAITLSTSRRASSKRSSAGNSRAICEIFSEPMQKDYSCPFATQARIGCKKPRFILSLNSCQFLKFASHFPFSSLFRQNT